MFKYIFPSLGDDLGTDNIQYLRRATVPSDAREARFGSVFLLCHQKLSSVSFKLHPSCLQRHYWATIHIYAPVDVRTVSTFGDG